MLLRVDGVRKFYPAGRRGLLGGRGGVVSAVDGVSFEIRRGETLGLVGETGCGKSTLARCITGLTTLTDGRIAFDGRDIAGLGRRAMRPIRRDLQMIFQDPYGSLNPRRRVGSIIADPFAVHHTARGGERRRMVQELMERVGLNPEHYNRFPADFSGGQRQRIGVARALASRPKLIVCDEPVSALDVSIQAQIINLLTDLQADYGLTYLFITHDLSVVRHVSDRIAVMYLGRLTEIGPSTRIHERTRHPYTRALLSAVPVPDPDVADSRQRIELPGEVASPADPPSGCRFHPRCPHTGHGCAQVQPPLQPYAGDPDEHRVACYYPVLWDQHTAESGAGRSSAQPRPGGGRMSQSAMNAAGGDRRKGASASIKPIQGRGPWRLAWERLRKDRVAMVSLGVILAIVAAAVFAPVIADLTGHGVNDQYRDAGLTPAGLPKPPSGQFWLGTDDLGRDILVRIAYGARVSLLVGLVATRTHGGGRCRGRTGRRLPRRGRRHRARAPRRRRALGALPPRRDLAGVDHRTEPEDCGAGHCLFQLGRRGPDRSRAGAVDPGTGVCGGGPRVGSQ